MNLTNGQKALIILIPDIPGLILCYLSYVHQRTLPFEVTIGAGLLGLCLIAAAVILLSRIGLADREEEST